MLGLVKRFKERAFDAATDRFPSLLSRQADSQSSKNLRVSVLGDCLDIVDDTRKRIIRLDRRNKVYVTDMLNSFDYYFGSASPIRVRRDNLNFQCVDFSTPRYQQVVGFDDFPLMCPSLTEPFITTRQYLDFAELRDGSVVLDLGAYSGLTTIAFSKAVGPQGRVLALEPDPDNFAAAATNIAAHRRINRLSNVDLILAAAHSERGVLSFSSEGAMGSADASVVGKLRGNVIDVEAYSLLDIADLHKLHRVDFVKMDIEGSEEPVMTSSGEFFRRFRPRIMIEPHMVRGTLSDQAIVRILDGFGYECRIIEQHGVKIPLVTGWPREN
jgi:FkbM family methyltransferase